MIFMFLLVYYSVDLLRHYVASDNDTVSISMDLISKKFTDKIDCASLARMALTVRVFPVNYNSGALNIGHFRMEHYMLGAWKMPTPRRMRHRIYLYLR
mgnify:CR=1 FL=1